MYLGTFLIPHVLQVMSDHPDLPSARTLLELLYGLGNSSSTNPPTLLALGYKTSTWYL